MSRIFYFAQCPKHQGGVDNFRVTLVFLDISYHLRTLSGIMDVYIDAGRAFQLTVIHV